MLPNEVFALACRARYEQMGLVVDKHNGEFAHCPLPKGMGESGYYLLHNDHQHQGLLQSRDVGQCCFFAGNAKRWLMNCKELPEGYFELWDIYEEYSRMNAVEAAKRLNEIIHADKDEFGRSVHALKSLSKVHGEKDELGRSAHAMEQIKKVHETFVGEKRSEANRKRAKTLGIDKLRSFAEKMNSQVWESTVDGFRSGAGQVAQHNRANGWDPAARIRIS